MNHTPSIPEAVSGLDHLPPNEGPVEPQALHVRLSQFTLMAWEHGPDGTNGWSIPREWVRTMKKLPRIVSEEQFQQFLKAAPDHKWAALFITALYTGMRLGELQALTWADVDFSNHRILLQAETNKGRRDEWIPMHTALVPVLRTVERSSGNE